MARSSWLIDSNRIATKIKSASETCELKKVKWKSNPTRACPKCSHTIDNSDVVEEWPGLPRGVKFDPSDQELLWHLLAKVGVLGMKPHPFIDEFIPTVDEEDGICYTHPQNLPGVKQDGSVSHFFHRSIKAYNTGTRKRRKIHNDDLGDVRWHKTGKTKPVIMDGVHKGCKKIMVLYMSMAKGEKSEKTNWVMHQYHLGTGEDESDGEFVVSKVFYQQQQSKQTDKNDQDPPLEIMETTITKVDPVTPKSVTPEPPRIEKPQPDLDSVRDPTFVCDKSVAQPISISEVRMSPETDGEDGAQPEWEKLDDHENPSMDDSKWWDGESQFLLDSQQLVEGLSLCDEILQSQPADGGNEAKKVVPCLSDYVHMGSEHLKKDLEECQNLSRLDLPNLELDTPPDLRLSQLEFESQDSYLAWGLSKVSD